MNITRRKKYSNNGYSVTKTEKRININFDLNTLNLMSAYAISENKYIRKSHLMNLRNLVYMLDLDLYMNDPEKMKRIGFIKKALEGRIVKGLKNTEAILKYTAGGIINEDILNMAQLPLLSANELEWLNDTVSESLKYVYLYDDADKLMDALVRFKNEDYINRSAIVMELEQYINVLQHNFRKAKVDSMVDMTFSLREDKFMDAMHDIYDKLTSPNRKLFSGMQGLNLLTNGGFESGRVYGFFGITGIGKSMTLLNVAKQIKKYNKGYKPKDPTKIPVIVIHTMENDVAETVKRLFDISTGAAPGDFKNMSFEEVMTRLKEDGELYLSDDNPIDIIIKYTPSGSIDTSYMYTLCEELEDDGYEVICYIQDHLKKIRSCYYKNADLRIELGEVINEMKAFAIIKDIPVITNSHLNREACAKLEAAAQSSKGDITRMLGKANIGESMLILDNIDFGFYVNVEYDANGNKLLCVLCTKNRDYIPINYIALPFLNKDSIQLVEDFYSAVPTFRDSVGPTVELNRKERTTSAYSNINMLYEDDDDDDIFGKGTSYNPSNIPLRTIEEEMEEMNNMIKCVSFTNQYIIPQNNIVPTVIFRDNSVLQQQSIA